MFNLGLFELLLFGMIALIVLGPEKLPVAARTLGKWYAFFRHSKERLQQEMMQELDLLQTQAEIKKELEKLRVAESQIKAQMDKLKNAVAQNQAHILDLEHHQPIVTAKHNLDNQPICHRFFLLGQYDQKRRLPNAPFLPNYQADRLLHQTNANNHSPDIS